MKSVSIAESVLESDSVKTSRDKKGNLVLDYTHGRIDIDLHRFIRKSVLKTDFKFLITENTIVKEKGKPVLVYLVLDDIYDKPYSDTLKKMEFVEGTRSQGLYVHTRNIGYMPRVTIRRDFCRSATLAYDDPVAHSLFCDLGIHLTKYYKRYCPEMFKFHSDKSKTLSEEWKIEGTPFSSGIINRNNALKYHYDTGNIKGVYSNMVCFKKNCEDGYLSLPEFDFALEVANKSVTFFDGQDIMHGVSPFKLKTYDAYRFTIVYYTLQRMWGCKPVDEELARIRTRRKEREKRRLEIMQGLRPVPKGMIDTIKSDPDKTLRSKQFMPYGQKPNENFGKKRKPE